MYEILSYFRGNYNIVQEVIRGVPTVEFEIEFDEYGNGTDSVLFYHVVIGVM